MPPRIWTTRAPGGPGLGCIDSTMASSAALHDEMPIDVPRLQRGLEIERRGGAEVADDLVFLLDAVDDDRFAQPVGRL